MLPFRNDFLPVCVETFLGGVAFLPSVPVFGLPEGQDSVLSHDGIADTWVYTSFTNQAKICKPDNLYWQTVSTELFLAQAVYVIRSKSQQLFIYRISPIDIFCPYLLSKRSYKDLDIDIRLIQSVV